MPQHHDNQSSHFNTGLLLGAIIGGAAALLLAPRSGKRNRQVVGERLEEAKTTWNQSNGDVYSTLNALFGGAIGRGQAQYQKARALLDEKLAEGKQNLADLRQKDLDTIMMDIRTKLEEMTEGDTTPGADAEYWQDRLREEWEDATSTMNNTSNTPGTSLRRGRGRGRKGA